MNPSNLPLRDVHEAVAPAWWPPAPGWWLVLGVCALALGVLAWRHWRRVQRRRGAARLFDASCAAAGSPAGRVEAISQLLRRAARRIDPAIATRDGDDWLRWLDQDLAQPVFVDGPGALLVDGAFRADVDEAAVESLRVIARARFLDLMERPR